MTAAFKRQFLKCIGQAPKRDNLARKWLTYPCRFFRNVAARLLKVLQKKQGQDEDIFEKLLDEVRAIDPRDITLGSTLSSLSLILPIDSSPIDNPETGTASSSDLSLHSFSYFSTCSLGSSFQVGALGMDYLSEIYPESFSSWTSGSSITSPFYAGPIRSTSSSEISLDSFSSSLDSLSF